VLDRGYVTHYIVTVLMLSRLRIRMGSECSTVKSY